MTGRNPTAAPGTVRPPFAYFGGKTRLAGRIAALLPDHDHYIEPFGGSLAVLLAKHPARAETVNDLDRRLVTFWRILRDHPDELARVCALTPHSRAEHHDARQPAESDLEQARRVWVELTQGRSGGLKPTGWKRFTTARGPNSTMPGYLAGYRRRIPACAERLARVTLECRPALELIRDYGQSTRALLYLDPPYLATTRHATAYPHDMPGEEEHRALAAAVHDCRAHVVISGYACALYEELYADWHRTTLTATTHRHSGGGHQRTEVLWSNVPFPAQPPPRTASRPHHHGPSAEATKRRGT
ncbi:DNA adenine methylase [Streptomyces sp. DSM 44917]|uniref:DNA adenine methylase n=1 Tax=Streptomyces boetiae TaxID=3075541 RepID=A0ABU2L6Y8_9ACTN|nr:DNA adenine methylase [Streptomyces sp. DSM 44917]MDT0307211.1 DNA adenine methylase [Streptomyces sp. DSM 44917]